jgi:hypothetical protein
MAADASGGEVDMADMTHWLSDAAVARIRETPQWVYCADGRKIAVTTWQPRFERDDAARIQVTGQLLDWRGTALVGRGLFDGTLLVCPQDPRTETGVILEIVTWTVQQALDAVTVTITGFPRLQEGMSDGR